MRHLVDQGCGQVDRPAGDAAPLDQTLHLHDDQAPAVVRCYGLHIDNLVSEHQADPLFQMPASLELSHCSPCLLHMRQPS